MLEKICSHCGTVLLVGLKHCPGCLRAIDANVVHARSTVIPAENSAGRMSPAESFLVDLEILYDNFIYPFKCLWAKVLRLPEPLEPPKKPELYRGLGFRQAAPELSAAHLSFSASYTRVVCPRCQRSQRAALEASPADMITCDHCMHTFPGSFAPEFRKGADLECYRCGVTTFCVSGLRVTTCPTCSASGQKVRAKTRIKPKLIIGFFALVFLSFLTHALVTQTTPQFIVGTCCVLVLSFFGFITMVALGF